MLRLVSRGSTLALLIAAAGSPGAGAADLAFDLRIEQGRVPDTARLMRVHEGDVVKLRCTSDRPVVLHLHGYDVEQRVSAGAVAELAFTATATGRFRIEIHAPPAEAGGHTHEGVPLAIIEVYPR